jgi:hypothetical protein
VPDVGLFPDSMSDPSDWLAYAKNLDVLLLSIPPQPGVSIWQAPLPPGAGPKALLAIFDKAETRYSVDMLIPLTQV